MRGGPPMRGGRGWGGGPRGFAPQVHTVFSIKGLFIIQSMNKIYEDWSEGLLAGFQGPDYLNRETET